MTDRELLERFASTGFYNLFQLRRLQNIAQKKVQEKGLHPLEDLLDRICFMYNVSVMEVTGFSRKQEIQLCRLEFIQEAHKTMKYSSEDIARIINRDPSTIRSHISRHLNQRKHMTEEQKAQHWTNVIDKHLNNTFRPFGKEVLEGIRDTIKQTGRVTNKQIQAIKNIRWGRNDEQTE